MKSIRQAYVESVDLNSTTPRLRYNTLRPQAELHLNFWLPIAEMLNPRGRRLAIGSAGLKFYEATDSLWQYHEVRESLQLMKEMVGVPLLSFGTYCKLRPLFCSLLKEAPQRDGLDLVACMVRQFARLELGLAIEAGYESINADCNDYHGLEHEFWAVEDEPWLAPSERLGTPDFRDAAFFCQVADRYEDADAFEHAFPGMGHRRVAALAAIRPILTSSFDLDTIADADRYMSSLLAIRFEDIRSSENMQSSASAAA
jgi:hypothetical protein